MLSWLPNALSLARMAGGVATALALAQGGFRAAALVFIAAALTDFLDGMAARALKAATPLGATLDLWADKVLVAGTLTGLLIEGRFALAGAVGLVALTLRDLAIMALRALRPSASLSASTLAKIKTALVMAGLGAFLLALVPGGAAWMAAAARIAFYAGCALSLITAAQYLAAARR